MKNCNFCLENNILKGKILLENEHCYFVESIDSVLRHAGMIITRRHIETPFEINEKEWRAIKDMMGAVRNLLDTIEKPGGYNIGWNVGAVAGQNVQHAHLHVIARFDDEPLSGKGIRYAFKQESNLREKYRK